jgi:hypothetical protein
MVRRAVLKLKKPSPGLTRRFMNRRLAAEVKLSLHSSYYQASSEQRQVFARIINDFPALDIQYRLERSLQSLPHDRFIHLTRVDGTEARIGIGAGLDFIRPNGRTCMTDIVIEDMVE